MLFRFVLVIKNGFLDTLLTNRSLRASATFTHHKVSLAVVYKFFIIQSFASCGCELLSYFLVNRNIVKCLLTSTAHSPFPSSDLIQV